MKNRIFILIFTLSLLIFTGCSEKNTNSEKKSKAKSVTVEPGRYTLDDSENSPYILINKNNTLQLYNFDNNEIINYYQKYYPEYPLPDNACDRLKEPYEYDTDTSDINIISFHMFDNYCLNPVIEYNKDDKIMVFLAKDYHFVKE